jgi:hypothetical protein
VVTAAMAAEDQSMPSSKAPSFVPFEAASCLILLFSLIEKAHYRNNRGSKSMVRGLLRRNLS